MAKPEPWNASDATDEIRKIGRSEDLNLSFSRHAADRMSERDLLVGDIRYVLKNGFVFEECEEASRPGLYKYRMESRTPNSSNRVVRLVVVPHAPTCWIKIITVMWVDEK